MNFQILNDVSHMLSDAGFTVGSGSVSDNPHAVHINSSSHSNVDEAAAYLVELTDGDLEIIETVDTDNGLRFITLEFV